MSIFKVSVINALVGVLTTFLFNILIALCVVLYLSPFPLVMEVLTNPRLSALVLDVTLNNFYTLPLCFVVIGLFTGESVITTTFKRKE